jgi:hypothetical protein
MSTSDATITLDTTDSTGFTISGSTLHMPVSSSGQLVVNVQDTNGNSMAAGTTVSFASSGSVVSAAAVGGTIVGCDAGKGGQNYSAALNSTTTTGGATISIKVTSPSGSSTFVTLPVAVP